MRKNIGICTSTNHTKILRDKAIACSHYMGYVLPHFTRKAKSSPKISYNIHFCTAILKFRAGGGCPECTFGFDWKEHYCTLSEQPCQRLYDSKYWCRRPCCSVQHWFPVWISHSAILPIRPLQTLLTYVGSISILLLRWTNLTTETSPKQQIIQDIFRNSPVVKLVHLSNNILLACWKWRLSGKRA